MSLLPPLTHRFWKHSRKLGCDARGFHYVDYVYDAYDTFHHQDS